MALKPMAPHTRRRLSRPEPAAVPICQGAGPSSPAACRQNVLERAAKDRRDGTAGPAMRNAGGRLHRCASCRRATCTTRLWAQKAASARRCAASCAPAARQPSAPASRDPESGSVTSGSAGVQGPRTAALLSLRACSSPAAGPPAPTLSPIPTWMAPSARTCRLGPVGSPRRRPTRSSPARRTRRHRDPGDPPLRRPAASAIVLDRKA
jgi:hypothetical protein